jgi:hypothetical protein
MTSAALILARASAAGIVLTTNGDRIRFDAPHGLPADLRAALVEHKAEVLDLLTRAPTVDSPSRTEPAEPRSELSIEAPTEAIGFTADDCPAFAFDESLAITPAQFRAAVEDWRVDGHCSPPHLQGPPPR